MEIEEDDAYLKLCFLFRKKSMALQKLKEEIEELDEKLKEMENKF